MLAALHALMFDLDAIATINVDQLATATDRLLHGGLRKRRPLARGSAPVVVVEEKTLYVRGTPARVVAPKGLAFAATLGAVAGCVAIVILRLVA